MVKWDAEKDRQLLLNWLTFTNGKIEKGLTDHLAGVIGEGAKPPPVLSFHAELLISRMYTQGGASSHREDAG